MISKKLFREAIESVYNFGEKQHKLYELGVDILDVREVEAMQSMIVSLLSSYFKNSESAGDTISWFMLETDFGKDADSMCITDDNIEYRLHDAGELYEYLLMDDNRTVETKSGDSSVNSQKGPSDVSNSMNKEVLDLLKELIRDGK